MVKNHIKKIIVNGERLNFLMFQRNRLIRAVASNRQNEALVSVKIIICVPVKS